MIDLPNTPEALLPVIPVLLIAFNEFLKKQGMSSRFCPVVNLLGGVAMTIPVLLQMGFGIFYAIIGGLIVGLSAGGFYSLGRSAIKTFNGGGDK